MKNLIVLILVAFHISCYAQEKTNLTEYVDPFIGTKGDGNTFPGATLPFGMVKLGPDCGEKTTNSGFKWDIEVQGFSHTHVSGTGGGPKYGNILVMPFGKEFTFESTSSMSSDNEASPGFYATHLDRHDIDASLTVSHSVGFHKYQFNQPGKRGIMIDIGSHLIGTCCNEGQELVGSEVKIISDTRVEGYTRVRNGWNKGDTYTVYFTAILDQPMTSYGLWKGSDMLDDTSVAFDSNERTGAYLMFDQKIKTIQMKVGISFLSSAKAFENIQQEIDHWNFDAVRKESSAVWNDMLKKIKVETDREDYKTMFYTGLYHALLMPSDRTGENPDWKSEKPYYDDFYAIWDTYRATHPLYMFLSPDRQRDIVNSLIDTYEIEGFMPDARSGNSTGRTQGGSNCDVLIADAYVKGLKGIDYEKALESMINNAEADPGFDHRKKGRGGVLDYNKLGYVSTDHERAGTRTVEYAYNDYCIYLVADGLGKEAIADKYLQRSENWKNLWKPVEDSGSKGFIMPRNSEGEWDEEFQGREWRGEKGWQPAEFTPHVAGTWIDFFYEADSWEYSFYVPHDVAGLIELSGGADAFQQRLDTFFARNYYNVGNEPSFLTATLYNYIGRQDRTLETVRDIVAQHYTTAQDGIPGNDDSGSMSAWLAFHLMGFYPNAGQDLYLITAPHFDKTVIDLGNNKSLTIEARNLSSKNIYIQKVMLNGEELKRSWYRHTEIAKGGNLVFYMGKKPNNQWEKAMPPRK